MTLRRRLFGGSGRGDDDRPRAAGRIRGGPAPGPSAGQGAGRQGASGRMKRAKPPNVVGRGPLLDSPGFGVVIVCIVRDEAHYLEEWMAYHVALGVDHFLIYDNGSTDGSADLLERYQNHGLVTRIDWPLGGGQLAAYNHALRFFGGAARLAGLLRRRRVPRAPRRRRHPQPSWRASRTWRSSACRVSSSATRATAARRRA